MAIWCSITAVWLAYHKKHLNGERLADDEERSLLAATIAISTGVDDVAKLNVPEEVGRRLIQCYGESGKK